MFKRLLLLILGCALALSAQAHPGHDGGNFSAGLLHPYTGLDHLLALVATGCWAALQTGRSHWRIPLGFMLGLVGGCWLGSAHLELPGLEWALAGSVLSLGLLLTLAVRWPSLLAMLISAGLALLHGWAHGLEQLQQHEPVPYLAGLVLSSALLLGLSYSASRWVPAQRRRGLRLMGMAIALVGGGLLLTVSG